MWHKRQSHMHAHMQAHAHACMHTHTHTNVGEGIARRPWERTPLVVNTDGKGLLWQ